MSSRVVLDDKDGCVYRVKRQDVSTSHKAFIRRLGN